MGNCCRKQSRVKSEQNIERILQQKQSPSLESKSSEMNTLNSDRTMPNSAKIKKINYNFNLDNKQEDKHISHQKLDSFCQQGNQILKTQTYNQFKQKDFNILQFPQAKEDQQNQQSYYQNSSKSESPRSLPEFCNKKEENESQKKGQEIQNYCQYFIFPQILSLHIQIKSINDSSKIQPMSQLQLLEFEQIFIYKIVKLIICSIFFHFKFNLSKQKFMKQTQFRFKIGLAIVKARAEKAQKKLKKLICKRWQKRIKNMERRRRIIDNKYDFKKKNEQFKVKNLNLNLLKQTNKNSINAFRIKTLSQFHPPRLTQEYLSKKVAYLRISEE